MKFKISDIILKKTEYLNVNYDLDIKEIEYLRETIIIAKPITLTGKFYRVGNDIGFEGMLETIAKTSCRRCLDDITTDVVVEISELITGTDEEVDYDFIDLVESEEVDLDAFIERIFLLKQPTVHLCDEDCKGLCPTCGINRNNDQCSCDNEDIDIRMMQFKELLEKN